MGLGMTVGMVCSHKKFLTDPHRASMETWEHMNKNAAANGAVMRTSILGCWQYDDMDKVIANTDKIARVTHHDGRCRASCIAITSIIANILQGKPYSTPEECEALIQNAYKLAVKYISPDHSQILTDYFAYKTVEEMKLDEKGAIGFTLKCMACGLYGLRSQKSFKRTLLDVIIEAGDADTNGAVCGATMGVKLGYSGLPKDWVAALPHKKWLDKKIVALLKLMKLVGNQSASSSSSSNSGSNSGSSDKKDNSSGSDQKADNSSNNNNASSNSGAEPMKH
jgi:ADP-ribosylglycohydrolase